MFNSITHLGKSDPASAENRVKTGASLSQGCGFLKVQPVFVWIMAPNPEMGHIFVGFSLKIGILRKIFWMRRYASRSLNMSIGASFLPLYRLI